MQQNAKYIIIKKYIDEDFQDILFEHTKTLKAEDVRPLSTRMCETVFSPTSSNGSAGSDISDASPDDGLAPRADETPLYARSLFCGRRVEEYTAIYRCRYCIASTYCDQCYRAY